jgi:hypothetical protein
MLYFIVALITWGVIFYFSFKNYFPSRQALYNNGRFVDSFFQASISTAILFALINAALKYFFNIDPLAL